jgi:hypothetical protein
MKNNIHVLSQNKWLDFTYNLVSGIITGDEIQDSLEKFKNEILLSSDLSNGKINKDLKLVVLFKIKSINNQYRTISPMQILEVKDFNQLNEVFLAYWSLKTDDYYVAQISDIIYTYKLVNTKSSPLKSKLILPDKFTVNKEGDFDGMKKDNLSFGGYNLPNSMNISTWGDIQSITENKYIIYKNKSNLEYHVELFDNYQLVEIKLEDKVLLSWKDIMRAKFDLSTFERVIKNQEYVFVEGKLIVKKIKKRVSFLSKVKQNIHNSKNFITMDLETRTINGEMSSYCVSIFDGRVFKSFYLTEFKTEKEMLRKSILYLMKRKYHNHKIYLHNFSKFDAIFLLSVITELSEKVTPIIRNGQFINLTLEFANRYKLYFRDSLLILPGSLRNLAKNFDVENKGIFPYKFVNNELINLNYVGATPAKGYFDNISLVDYINYHMQFKINQWNLKDETIKYCELDCLVLYQIIDKFSDRIYELFKIDILKYPTLSSLAFVIFRSKFLKDAEIPLIHGEMYKFLQKAYTGGSVDVYKPTREISDSKNKSRKSKIRRYDVNSLYPSVMKNFPMPCGTPIYFEGDILNTQYNSENLFETISDVEDKPFGVFEAEIEAPPNIKIPLLQVKIKTVNGYKTIAPVGTWTAYYFSDELYNAKKYGYKFKVKRGYIFPASREKGNYFSEYVDFLYNLKKNSKKGTPNYITSKLLLNSLYGRLGMNPICEQHLIVSNAKAMGLYDTHYVTNILDLKNGKELISFFHNDPKLSVPESEFDLKNVSVVVSAVVTASARIFMTQFKTNKNLILYYSDTDSIDIEGDIDSNLIGDGLGQMKLEHEFNDAVFLAPKTYGGITDDYEYVRIKGLKNPIKFVELKTLLAKNSKLEIEQEKWYRDISNGMFHIRNEIYTLMITDNKRKLIFDSNNQFIDTVPIELKDGIIVD